MALKKTVVLENGFEGEYWKVTSLMLNKQNLMLEASIGLFKSKTYADKSNIRPEKIISVKFKIQNEKAKDDLVKLVYQYIESVLDGSINPGQFDPGKLIQAQLQGAVSDEINPL